MIELEEKVFHSGIKLVVTNNALENEATKYRRMCQRLLGQSQWTLARSFISQDLYEKASQITLRVIELSKYRNPECKQARILKAELCKIIEYSVMLWNDAFELWLLDPIGNKKVTHTKRAQKKQRVALMRLEQVASAVLSLH